MNDPLDACRARWRDAPPLTDGDLAVMLPRDAVAYNDQTTRLVAEVLRLQTEIERLTAMVQAGHVHEWATYTGKKFDAFCWRCWDQGGVVVWWTPDEANNAD